MKTTILASLLTLASLPSFADQPSTGRAPTPDAETNLLAAIEEATGWTCEELANGLAMLDRVYSNDCATAQGRVRWHGKVTRTLIDTNALTKAQVHEDGYVHVVPFNSAVPPTIDERISAAERKERQEEAKRRRASAEAKKKADRIASLQTNMTALATALAAEKQYPVDLATMLLQHELNTLVGTNVVNATVTPQ